MPTPFRGSGPFRGRGSFRGRGPWAGKGPWSETLGPQLVVNGGFDSASGWTLGTGWSISGGTADRLVGTAGELAQTVGTLIVGREYVVRYDIPIASNTMNFVLGNNYVAGNGTVGTGKTVRGVCTTNSVFRVQGSGEYHIDNISVREVL